MHHHRWSSALLLVSACGTEVMPTIAIDDASLALPPRSFEIAPLPVPEEPAAIVPAMAPAFAQCPPGQDDDLCFPFAMPTDLACADGELLYPTATSCQELTPCVESFPPDANAIFVDDDAVAGGDGSHARPFRSIASAIQAAANGGTVRVQPGRYLEQVSISRGITVEGACPTTTTITMTSAAPSTNRQLVALDSGTLRGFRVLGHADGRAQNWAGIASVAQGTTNHIEGVLLEHLAYGVFLGANVSLQAEHVRTRFAHWRSSGSLTVHQSEFDGNIAAILHFSGELAVTDTRMIGAPTDPQNSFFGILAPSAALGLAATGSIRLADVVVSASVDAQSSIGVHAGGSVAVAIDRAHIAADVGIALDDNATATLRSIAIEARQTGVLSNRDSTVDLENARIVGLFDEPIRYSWDGVQAGLRLFGSRGDIRRTLIAHFVGNAAQGGDISRPATQFRFTDVTLTDIRQLSEGNFGAGIVGTDVTLERVSASDLRWAFFALRLDASDLSIENAAGGIAGFDLTARRFRATNVDSVVLSSTDMVGLTPTALPGAQLSVDIEDATFSVGDFAAIVFDHQLFSLKRARISGMRQHCIQVVDTARANLEDVLIADMNPEQRYLDGPEHAAGVVAVRSAIDARDFVVRQGDVPAGGMAVTNGSATLRSTLFSGGEFGFVALGNEQRTDAIDVSNAVLSDMPTGVWIINGELANSFRTARFVNVSRTVTLGTLPVPTFSESDFDLGLGKPTSDTPFDVLSPGSPPRFNALNVDR